MLLFQGEWTAVLLLLFRLKGRKEAIPYGPFLAAGAMFTLLMGKGAGWYLDLLP